MNTETGTDTSGMPFGAVFGALFFALYSGWLLVGSPAEVSPILPRAFLALACVALALALAGRRGWARWAGAAGAIGVAAISLRLFGLDHGPTALVAVLGALLTLALLLVPATGELRAPRGAGRALAAAAGLGVVGFVASAWLVGDAALEARVPDVSRGSTRPTGAGAPSTPARVAWTEFAAALERSRVESKPILATFVTGWCGYCRKMDQTTWRDPGVVARLGDVVAVRLDAEDAQVRNGYSGQALAERYGVEGYPTLVVLDTGGRVVARTSGYLPPRDLIDWLDRVVGRGRPQRLVSNPVPAS